MHHGIVLYYIYEKHFLRHCIGIRVPPLAVKKLPHTCNHMVHPVFTVVSPQQGTQFNAQLPTDGFFQRTNHIQPIL